MLPIAPLLAISMAAGATALMIMSGPVLALSAAVVMMAGIFTAAFPADEATEAADGLASVLESAGSIVDSILGMQEQLDPAEPQPRKYSRQTRSC